MIEIMQMVWGHCPEKRIQKECPFEEGGQIKKSGWSPRKRVDKAAGNLSGLPLPGQMAISSTLLKPQALHSLHFSDNYHRINVNI